MKIIDRYILKEFVLALVGTLFICIVVLLVYMIIDVYEDILENSPRFYYVASYFLNSMPLQLLEVFPLAVAIAVLYSISRLARNNEVLALVSSGVSQLRLALPLLVFAIILCLATIYFGEMIMPHCQQRAAYIEKAFIKGKGQEIITKTKDIFVKGRDNWFYTMKGFDSRRNDMIEPNLIETNQDGSGIKQRIIARRGQLIKGHGKESRWLLYDATVRTYDRNNKLVSTKTHNEPIEIELEKDLEQFLSYRKEPEEMNLLELRDYVKFLSERGEQAGDYRTELHLKLSFPFSIFIIMLTCFSFASHMTVGTATINFALGVSSVLAFYAVVALFRALGHNLVVPPVVAAWFPDLFFLGAGGYIFYRNMF